MGDLFNKEASWWRYMRIKCPSDGRITVYRGIRPGNPKIINPGDWVTTSKKYARCYGKVISIRVPLLHVEEASTNCERTPEFFYRP